MLTNSAARLVYFRIEKNSDINEFVRFVCKAEKIRR